MKTIIIYVLLFAAALQLTAQESPAPQLAPQSSAETTEIPQAVIPAVDPPEGQPPTESPPVIDESELIIGEGDTTDIDTAPLNTFRLVDLLRMILVLAAVLGAIYLIFLLLRRFSGGTKRPSTGSMRLMDTLSLASNRSLHIVEIGQQLFVVGVGEHGVSLVAEIEEQETIDEIRLKSSVEREHVGPNFAELIGGLFQKRESSGRSDPFQFLRQSRERLKRL